MGIKSIWNRLTRIGEAEAHHGIDKMEDPIIMTKQGLRELREKLDRAFTAQAKVKAAEIRLNANANKLEDDANEWNRKANRLQDKIDQGELESDRGEPLIIEALNHAENALTEAKKMRASAQSQIKVISNLDEKVRELRNLISDVEADLVTLTLRAETASIRKEVNKELGTLGSSDSTRELLARMKTKVEEDEALADAYESLGKETKETKDEIDSILSDSKTDNAILLENFRKERNIEKV